jgi:hypothetical protein
MRTEEFNKGVGLRVPQASFRQLYRAISAVREVAFTLKRNSFFLPRSSFAAEFRFKGQVFAIETDQRDGALWILTKDRQKHEAEMEELKAAVERFPSGWLAGFFSFG